MANDYTPQQIEEILQMFFDVAGTRQYIGARYVPIFGRGRGTSVEWDNSDAYEPLSIVYYQGDTYTSRRYVPAGIPIDNQDYWVITGRYNAQVEQYRQEVLSFQGQIDTLRNDMQSDYVPFPDALVLPKYGALGQVLTTLANGKTKWEDPVTVDAEIAGPLIDDWLDAHPEATTTVQDGAITNAKLSPSGLIKYAMQFKGSMSIYEFNTNYGDLEDAPENSIIRFQSKAGGTLTDAPSNELGTIFTFGFNDPLLRSQMYIESVSHGNIYLRYRYSSNNDKVWSNWLPLVPEPNLTPYPQYLGSISVAQFVSYYTSFDDMANNTIVKLQAHGGQTTIPGAPSNNLGLLMTFGSTSTPLKAQIYFEAPDAHNIYMRTQVSMGGQFTWKDWEILGGDTREYVIEKSGTNSSLLEGILYCYEHDIKNVRVKPGTYDMVAEYQAKYGSDWDTEIGTYKGIPLGNGIRIVFDDGAKVVFNYTGGEANIHTYLSMFNTIASDCYVEGLDLECSNLRYGIHDDCSYSTSPYVHMFKNCKIRKVDTNSDWTSCHAIAGGFGSDARVEIDGGIFMCNNTTVAPENVSDTIYYHNNGAQTGSNATVYIHGIYCYGPSGTLHSGSQIQQDSSVAEMFVYGCRFNKAPTENEPLAIKLYAWDNEIQTD